MEDAFASVRATLCHSVCVCIYMTCDGLATRTRLAYAVNEHIVLCDTRFDQVVEC